MDPVTLAAAAMAAIRPFLGKFTDAAATKAAEATAGVVGSGALDLYRTVRKRMARDSYHAAILQGAEDQPGSEDRVETLSRTLAAIIKTDPDFAAAIEQLTGQGAQDITVTDSGAVAGRDVNITAVNAAARDLTIGVGPLPRENPEGKPPRLQSSAEPFPDSPGNEDAECREENEMTGILRFQ